MLLPMKATKRRDGCIYSYGKVGCKRFGSSSDLSGSFLATETLEKHAQQIFQRVEWAIYSLLFFLSSFFQLFDWLRISVGLTIFNFVSDK